MPAQRIRFRPTDADYLRGLVTGDDDSVSDVIREALREYNKRPEVANVKPERASVVLATFVADDEMRNAVQKASREGRVLSDVLMEIIRQQHA